MTQNEQKQLPLSVFEALLWRDAPTSVAVILVAESPAQLRALQQASERYSIAMSIPFSNRHACAYEEHFDCNRRNLHAMLRSLVLDAVDGSGAVRPDKLSRLRFWGQELDEMLADLEEDSTNEGFRAKDNKAFAEALEAICACL